MDDCHLSNIKKLKREEKKRKEKKRKERKKKKIPFAKSTIYFILIVLGVIAN
jgi:cytoskeletal protein RodZ